MDVKCPRCGTENEAGKLTCEHCGGHLPVGPPARKATPPASSGQPFEQTPAEKPAVPPTPPQPGPPAPAGQATRKLNLMPREQAASKAGMPAAPPTAQQPAQPAQQAPQPQGAAASARGPAAPAQEPQGKPGPAQTATVGTQAPPQQHIGALPPLTGSEFEEPGAEEEVEAAEQPDGGGQPRTGFIPAQLNPQQLAQIQAQQAALLQQQYAMMAQYQFGMPSPFWPPMSPYYPGMTGPFPMMPFAPPGMPPYGFPPQQMAPMGGPYPGYGQPMQQPYGAPWPQGAGAGPGPGPWPSKKKRHTGLIVTIVVIVLLLIAGGVTAAILLTRKTKSSFNLGSGSVIGAKIEFTNLKLAQNGSALTLTGSYKNSSKKKGTCTLTIQGISGGTERMISFSVPVSSVSSTTTFSQRKTSTVKLSGATLGPIVFNSSSSSSSGSNSDSETSPWDSSPYGSETLPYESSPLDTTPLSPKSTSTTPSF